MSEAKNDLLFDDFYKGVFHLYNSQHTEAKHFFIKSIRSEKLFSNYYYRNLSYLGLNEMLNGNKIGLVHSYESIKVENISSEVYLNLAISEYIVSLRQHSATCIPKSD
jgi:hypothetical protein